MCWLAHSGSNVIAKAQQISFLASTEMCFLSWVTCDICPWKAQYSAHLNLSRGQQRLRRSEGLWGQRISDSQHGLYCWICGGNNRPHILAWDIYVDQSTVILHVFCLLAANDSLSEEHCVSREMKSADKYLIVCVWLIKWVLTWFNTKLLRLVKYWLKQKHYTFESLWN